MLRIIIVGRVHFFETFRCIETQQIAVYDFIGHFEFFFDKRVFFLIDFRFFQKLSGLCIIIFTGYFSGT